MENNENINVLIAKRLSGEASPEELQQLQQWTEADPRNTKELESLTLAMQEINRLLAAEKVDTSHAWQKLENRINKPKNAKIILPKGQGYFLIRKLAVAAIICCIIAGAWFFTRPKEDKQWQSLAAVNTDINTILPDGSSVWVRKGSNIKWRADFNKERKIQLSGEAFFDVKHYKENGFSVVTEQSIVRVVGTAFLVRSDKFINEVVVRRGKVKVTGIAETGTETILSEGQKAILEKDHFVKTAVSDSNYMAWKTRRLDFKGASLQKVLSDVSDYYQKPISVDSKELAEKTIITVRFDNETLSQVLDEIRLITGFEMKTQGDSVIYHLK